MVLIVFLLLLETDFRHYSDVSILEFEQVNAGGNINPLSAKAKNGQTHSNSSLMNCLIVFDHFEWLALKRLRCLRAHQYFQIFYKRHDEEADPGPS